MGKHKLIDKWEADVYVVIKRAGDLPVYTVRPETKDGPKRTLHRDLLLPCGFLPPSAQEEVTQPTPVRRPRTCQHHDSETSFADLHTYDEEDDNLGGWIFQCSVQPSTSNGTACDPLSALNVGNSSESVDADSLPGPVEENLENEELLDNLPGPVENEELLDNLPGPVENEELLDNLLGPVEENLSIDTLTGGNLPDGEAVENPDQPLPAEPSLEVTVDSVPSSDVTAVPATNSAEVATSLRCSHRHQEPPQRLQYTQLGNPLISIVQTLFQSLSSAYTEALTANRANSQSTSKVPVE